MQRYDIMLDTRGVTPVEGELPVGYWWRAEEYVIRDGYIRPAPGARFVRYDPWEHYRFARLHGKQEDPAPYQELLGLTDIRFVYRKGGFEAEPDDARRVLEWCNRYGLLGVLLHRVREVRLAPRWQRISWPPEAEPNLLFPTQRRMTRAATGWRSQDTHPLDGWVIQDEPEREGTLVEEDMRPQGMTSGVVIRRLGSFGWEWEPLTKTWASFFPDTPREERETREYPLPLSDEFWREYGEHISHFLGAARTLEDALRALQEPSEVLRGRDKINALAEDVNLVLSVGADGFRQAWVAPSLLGALAAMAILDLAGGKRVLRCETCGRPFVSGAPAARYCSPTCRHTAQKRAYRQRIRQAKELHAQGLSVEEIAARLGSDAEIVHGWLQGRGS